ncbi:4-alpha-glucanotransferase [Tundrisphaera sp. TA3]|uniref:4-alpha-glucanotransferase n=1 Tax=Tundrisphaera sp. TA3 TaxID=3435775 RepID=UPI003EBAAF18
MIADAPAPEPLRDLARRHGIQVEYIDTSGRTQPAPARSLLSVLRVLGAPVATIDDAPAALLAHRMEEWNRRLEPVVVAWHGAPSPVLLRLRDAEARGPAQVRLTFESGGDQGWSIRLEDLDTVASEVIGGEAFSAKRLILPDGLPTGYHRLTVASRDVQAESLVIAAPPRVYSEPEKNGKRPWGLFCPLYALHGSRSRGGGDLGDLDALMDWTAGLGGGLIATLPMLAAHFDGEDPIISPYSPTSRLFWNEFYLDLERIPEAIRTEAAKDAWEGGATMAEVAALRSGDLVHYGRQMSQKRRALGLMADGFFEGEGEYTASYRAFLEERPDVEDYATFQAAGESLGRNWRSWPSTIDRNSVDPSIRNYHLFAQWQADEQLRELADKARAKGLSWYLDFPVGVDGGSYDVWRERDSFAIGASVGCPPDLVFTKGQNWGFPPLHPARQRENGYRYLIASFRNHFRHARALRIDHVMGLHRLFWIPDGAEARDGAFVSTPADEIYAILSIESHRREAWLVGENLGTVPPEVEESMTRHGVRGMYVVQYEARPDPEHALPPAPEATVASVNTHDMPPFAAFWRGLDLEDRRELGLLDDTTYAQETEARDLLRRSIATFLRGEGFLAEGSDDERSILHAMWDWLAASPSRVLLLNVEDFWLETEPQNTPNTVEERPNWRRKLRQSFEEFSRDPAVLSALRRVDALRTSSPRPQKPAPAPAPVADAASPVTSPSA